MYLVQLILRNIQYVGHWVPMLYSILRIGMAVKYVHVSGMVCVKLG